MSGIFAAARDVREGSKMDAMPGPGGPRILDAAATRAALSDCGALAEALGRALVAIARGEVSVPARVAAFAAHGLLGAMPGYVPGLGLAAKLVTVFEDPSRPGRSSHRGVVVVFDETDGRPLAVLDAEPLTALRTAATSVLALRTLARPDARRVALVGTGTLAGAHLELLASDPRWSVTVAGRSAERAVALARRFDVSSAVSIEEAVHGADAVLCCTGAREPVLAAHWLAPGTYVGSVGGSQGPELDAETVRAARVFVEWAGAAAEPAPAGAHELQGLEPGRVTLLGTVLAGDDSGGQGAYDADGLTVFKSTGHAALDVAAAAVALRSFAAAE
jgi:alanine dehydrogenase